MCVSKATETNIDDATTPHWRQLPGQLMVNCLKGSCPAVVRQLTSIGRVYHVAFVCKLCQRVRHRISGLFEFLLRRLQLSSTSTCTQMEQPRSRATSKRGPMKWEACKVCHIANVTYIVQLTFTLDTSIVVHIVYTVGVTQQPITPPHHPSITPAKAPRLHPPMSQHCRTTSIDVGSTSATCSGSHTLG